MKLLMWILAGLGGAGILVVLVINFSVAITVMRVRHRNRVSREERD